MIGTNHLAQFSKIENFCQFNKLIYNTPDSIRKLAQEKQLKKIVTRIWQVCVLILSAGCAAALIFAKPIILGIGVIGSLALVVYGVYLRHKLKNELPMRYILKALLEGKFLEAAPKIKSLFKPEILNCKAKDQFKKTGLLKPEMADAYKKTQEEQVEQRLFTFENAMGRALFFGIFQSIKVSKKSDDLTNWKEDAAMAEALCLRSSQGLQPCEKTLINLIKHKPWKEIKQYVDSLERPFDATVYGPITVDLKENENGLTAEIQTKRLRIDSVNTKDFLPDYITLYGNHKVMKSVSAGFTKDESTTKQRMEGTWLKRWQTGVPFAAMAIQNREGEFIGHIMLRAPKEDKKTTELSYCIQEKYWGKQYGSEAAYAVIYHFTKAIFERQKAKKETAISKVIATAWTDNEPSQRILSKWMHFDGEERGTSRPINYSCYHIDIEDILSHHKEYVTQMGIWKRGGSSSMLGELVNCPSRA